MATFTKPWFTNYQFRSSFFPVTAVTRRQNVHFYMSRDSTSCHVIARDISRFHSVFLWTGYRHSFKSKHSNVKSKNAAFVNISSSLHSMLLFIASACPLTISAMGKLFKVDGSRALKIQQKFHVLFLNRIVVGEIPVFWLNCLTETSFSSSKSAMYARYSSLKARVKTMQGK